MSECVICNADQEESDRVWYAYAGRLRLRDALRVAQKQWPDAELTSELVQAHLHHHPFVQPTPPGKLNRGMALQEALAGFRRHSLFLLLAIYRAKSLSARQIYQFFYLDHAEDSEDLRALMARDLRKLSYRSFLYQLWPENVGTLSFPDPGPYYFLNRQACPVVERLEGLESSSLPFGQYVTSISQVKEFYMERDARFMDVVTAMRAGLYQRSFLLEGREVTVHLGVEHWYAPVQLFCELPNPNGGEGSHFAPSGLFGLRVESRDGALSALLPVWFEYDRGTEEADETVDEILRYAAYYSSSFYKTKFPRLAAHNNPGPLIVLCDDAYRRQEMVLALRDRVGDRHVPIYFTERPTLLRDPYAQGVLTGIADPDRHYSLLERVVHHNKALIDQRVFAGTDRLTAPTIAQLAARAETASRSDKRDDRLDLSAWTGEAPPPAPKADPRGGGRPGAGRPDRGGRPGSAGRPTGGGRSAEELLSQLKSGKKP